MSFKYERKINYYETDRMGVVHNSNYIRYLEETRCEWLEYAKMPFGKMEAEGITIPVLGVNCKYKHHVTFGDTIVIEPYLKEYSGVRMTVGYKVTEKGTEELVLTGETKHCFTSREIKPINLKKVAPHFSEKFQKLLDEYNSTKS